MKLARNALLALLLIVFLHSGFQTAAQDAGGHSHNGDLLSPYHGQDQQEIKTLSDEDIEQLRTGGGWGLAKAAELNGVPGPIHILEIAEAGKLQLSEHQLSRIRALYEEMKGKAIPLGLQLIDQERKLNQRFADGNISEEELHRLLAQIADTTSQLRYTHLSAHLQTPGILTLHQIVTYNRIRGYSFDGHKE
jgi:hypothetical protein